MMKKIIQEYNKQDMRCPVHLSIGQEGIPAGVLAATRILDIVSRQIIELNITILLKDVTFIKMTAEIYGKKWLCRRQRWINAFNRFI